MSELSLARFKPCSCCRILYPATATFFYHAKAKKYGFSSRCRTCAKLRSRDWHWENRDKALARSREYSRADQERRREYQREWRERNREYDRARRNAAQKRRYKNSDARAKNAAACKAWREKYPEANAAKQRNYRARKLKAEGTHTAGEVKQMYADQGGLCAYCECELNGTHTVDHMVPLVNGGRNDWINLAVVCTSCNSEKGVEPLEVFISDRMRSS